MVRNTLMDLNNHLFEQMERLNDDGLTDESLEREMQRSSSMSAISGKIIENAKLSLEAEKYKSEYAGGAVNLPKMIDG